MEDVVECFVLDFGERLVVWYSISHDVMIFGVDKRSSLGFTREKKGKGMDLLDANDEVDNNALLTVENNTV
jgi:hypothetical protein